MVAWREGSAEQLSSRFARQRVRAAHRDTKLSRPRAEEWLLIEWPENENEPTKYWLASLAEDIAIGWSTWPNCAGGSSAIIRSSSRNSAWVTMKGAGGAASTTMPRSVLPPTAF